eukprot:g32475.t1
MILEGTRTEVLIKVLVLSFLLTVPAVFCYITENIQLANSSTGALISSFESSGQELSNGVLTRANDVPTRAFSTVVSAFSYLKY